MSLEHLASDVLQSVAFCGLKGCELERIFFFAARSSFAANTTSEHSHPQWSSSQSRTIVVPSLENAISVSAPTENKQAAVSVSELILDFPGMLRETGISEDVTAMSLCQGSPIDFDFDSNDDLSQTYDLPSCPQPTVTPTLPTNNISTAPPLSLSASEAAELLRCLLSSPFFYVTTTESAPPREAMLASKPFPTTFPSLSSCPRRLLSLPECYALVTQLSLRLPGPFSLARLKVGCSPIGCAIAGGISSPDLMHMGPLSDSRMELLTLLLQSTVEVPRPLSGSALAATIPPPHALAGMAQQSLFSSVSMSMPNLSIAMKTLESMAVVDRHVSENTLIRPHNRTTLPHLATLYPYFLAPTFAPADAEHHASQWGPLRVPSYTDFAAAPARVAPAQPPAQPPAHVSQFHTVTGAKRRHGVARVLQSLLAAAPRRPLAAYTADDEADLWLSALEPAALLPADRADRADRVHMLMARASPLPPHPDVHQLPHAPGLGVAATHYSTHMHMRARHDCPGFEYTGVVRPPSGCVRAPRFSSGHALLPPSLTPALLPAVPVFPAQQLHADALPQLVMARCPPPLRGLPPPLPPFSLISADVPIESLPARLAVVAGDQGTTLAGLGHVLSLLRRKRLSRMTLDQAKSSVLSTITYLEHKQHTHRYFHFLREPTPYSRFIPRASSGNRVHLQARVPGEPLYLDTDVNAVDAPKRAPAPRSGNARRPARAAPRVKRERGGASEDDHDDDEGEFTGSGSSSGSDSFDSEKELVSSDGEEDEEDETGRRIITVSRKARPPAPPKRTRLSSGLGVPLKDRADDFRTEATLAVERGVRAMEAQAQEQRRREAAMAQSDEGAVGLPPLTATMDVDIGGAGFGLGGASSLPPLLPLPQASAALSGARGAAIPTAASVVGSVVGPSARADDAIEVDTDLHRVRNPIPVPAALAPTPSPVAATFTTIGTFDMSSLPAPPLLSSAPPAEAQDSDEDDVLSDDNDANATTTIGPRLSTPARRRASAAPASPPADDLDTPARAVKREPVATKREPGSVKREQGGLKRERTTGVNDRVVAVGTVGNSRSKTTTDASTVQRELPPCRCGCSHTAASAALFSPDDPEPSAMASLDPYAYMAADHALQFPPLRDGLFVAAPALVHADVALAPARMDPQQAVDLAATALDLLERDINTSVKDEDDERPRTRASTRTSSSSSSSSSSSRADVKEENMTDAPAPSGAPANAALRPSGRCKLSAPKPLSSSPFPASMFMRLNGFLSSYLSRLILLHRHIMALDRALRARAAASRQRHADCAGCDCEYLPPLTFSLIASTMSLQVYMEVIGLIAGRFDSLPTNPVLRALPLWRQPQNHQIVLTSPSQVHRCQLQLSSLLSSLQRCRLLRATSVPLAALTAGTWSCPRAIAQAQAAESDPWRGCVYSEDFDTTVLSAPRPYANASCSAMELMRYHVCEGTFLNKTVKTLSRTARDLLATGVVFVPVQRVVVDGVLFDTSHWRPEKARASMLRRIHKDPTLPVIAGAPAADLLDGAALTCTTVVTDCAHSMARDAPPAARPTQLAPPAVCRSCGTDCGGAEVCRIVDVGAAVSLQQEAFAVQRFERGRAAAAVLSTAMQAVPESGSIWRQETIHSAVPIAAAQGASDCFTLEHAETSADDRLGLADKSFGDRLTAVLAACGEPVDELVPAATSPLLPHVVVAGMALDPRLDWRRVMHACGSDSSYDSVTFEGEQLAPLELPTAVDFWQHVSTAVQPTMPTASVNAWVTYSGTQEGRDRSEAADADADAEGEDVDDVDAESLRFFDDKIDERWRLRMFVPPPATELRKTYGAVAALLRDVNALADASAAAHTKQCLLGHSQHSRVDDERPALDPAAHLECLQCRVSLRLRLILASQQTLFAPWFMPALFKPGVKLAMRPRVRIAHMLSMSQHASLVFSLNTFLETEHSSFNIGATYYSTTSMFQVCDSIALASSAPTLIHSHTFLLMKYVEMHAAASEQQYECSSPFFLLMARLSPHFVLLPDDDSADTALGPAPPRVRSGFDPLLLLDMAFSQSFIVFIKALEGIDDQAVIDRLAGAFHAASKHISAARGDAAAAPEPPSQDSEFIPLYSVTSPPEPVAAALPALRAALAAETEALQLSCSATVTSAQTGRVGRREVDLAPFEGVEAALLGWASDADPEVRSSISLLTAKLLSDEAPPTAADPLLLSAWSRIAPHAGPLARLVLGWHYAVQPPDIRLQPNAKKIIDMDAVEAAQTDLLLSSALPLDWRASHSPLDVLVQADRGQALPPASSASSLALAPAWTQSLATSVASIGKSVQTVQFLSALHLAHSTHANGCISIMTCSSDMYWATASAINVLMHPQPRSTALLDLLTMVHNSRHTTTAAAGAAGAGRFAPQRWLSTFGFTSSVVPAHPMQVPCTVLYTPTGAHAAFSNTRFVIPSFPVPTSPLHDVGTALLAPAQRLKRRITRPQFLLMIPIVDSVGISVAASRRIHHGLMLSRPDKEAAATRTKKRLTVTHMTAYTAALSQLAMHITNAISGTNHPRLAVLDKHRVVLPDPAMVPTPTATTRLQRLADGPLARPQSLLDADGLVVAGRTAGLVSSLASVLAHIGMLGAPSAFALFRPEMVLDAFVDDHAADARAEDAADAAPISALGPLHMAVPLQALGARALVLQLLLLSSSFSQPKMLEDVVRALCQQERFTAYSVDAVFATIKRSPPSEQRLKPDRYMYSVARLMQTLSEASLAPDVVTDTLTRVITPSPLSVVVAATAVLGFSRRTAAPADADAEEDAAELDLADTFSGTGTAVELSKEVLLAACERELFRQTVVPVYVSGNIHDQSHDLTALRRQAGRALEGLSAWGCHAQQAGLADPLAQAASTHGFTMDASLQNEWFRQGVCNGPRVARAMDVVLRFIVSQPANTHGHHESPLEAVCREAAQQLGWATPRGITEVVLALVMTGVLMLREPEDRAGDDQSEMVTKRLKRAVGGEELAEAYRVVDLWEDSVIDSFCVAITNMRSVAAILNLRDDL